MTKCSWTGGSRSGEDKIALKSYTKVVEVFFLIINASDERFNQSNCHEFFKNVLRNSTRRNSKPAERISKAKVRPKNLQYKKKETKENVEEDEVVENDLDEGK